jgi:hypothetical protein
LADAQALYQKDMNKFCKFHGEYTFRRSQAGSCKSGSC